MLDPVTSARSVVLGVGGSGDTEEAGVVGNGVMVAGAGSEDAGT